MKRSLVALATLAAAATASAQSSITLYGIVDATFAHGSGSISSKSQLTNSGLNSSQLGFRGIEDLGGGMSASFWLEASLNNDNGTGTGTNTNNQASGAAPAAAGGQGLTFNRRSTVSLAGGWGELRLGRDYTPQFWNLTVYDPSTTLGVGTTQTLLSGLGGPTGVRASNSIGYFLPSNIGGLYGQAQYYLGENNSNCTAAGTPAGCGGPDKDGTGYGLRVGFAQGPFTVAVAHSSTKFATGDISQTNIGGAWDFGVAKLMGHYTRDHVGSAVAVTGHGGLIGALVPVGVGTIRFSYSRYSSNALTSPAAKKFALGYVYNLSKRTAVYATWAHVSNEGSSAQSLNGSTTAAGGSSSGYDFGLRHSF